MWPFNRRKRSEPVTVPESADEPGEFFPSDADERLADERVVRLEGEIDDEQANRIIQQLLFLQFDNPARPLTIEITDSPGGTVAATLAILDTISFLGCSIHTRCQGRAGGGAAIILACGARGHRTARPNACIAITEIWAEDESNNERALEQDRRRLAAILARYSGRSEQEWLIDLQFGHKFEVETAIRCGIVDRIEA
jgi:ATP-dependent Clp protease protease subunit